MRLDGTLLTFDLAGNTGFAWGLPGAMPQFGSHKFDSTGDNIGRHQLNIRKWIRLKFDEVWPDVVGYEQPSIFGKTTPTTIIKLCSYAATLEEECLDRCRVRQINPSRLKKFWTSNGRADKKLMVDYAWKYGFRVLNDDEADAVACWFMMVDAFGTEEQRAVFQQMRLEVGMGVTQREVF